MALSLYAARELVASMVSGPLAALESRVARARDAACVDPPACRALALAYEQTSWRLANRLCGGLLESLDRVVALARSALDGMGRALAQFFAALTAPSARKATPPCPT